MLTITQIATSQGLPENELFRQALVSYLLDKKRQAMQLKLEILSRYGAASLPDLETKIANGIVVEHPAWEDLIVVENLTERLEEMDVQLGDLQRVA
jgi:hypothetical protein